MKININDSVQVILTEFGAKHYNDILNRYLNKYGIEYKNFVAGDVLKLQLWSLMEDFGSVISLGCEMPFNTDIEIVNNV